MQKRQKRLEKAKQEELLEIEDMYSNLAAKDSQFAEDKTKDSPYTTSYILRFWILGAVVVYFSYIIFKTLDAVYLILAAFVVSMIMDAPISFFKKRMPRRLAITVSYLLVLVLVFIIVVVVLPFVINQIADVLTIAIAKINQFQILLRTDGLTKVIEDHVYLPSSIKSYILEGIHSDEFISTLQKKIQENISQIVSTGTSYVTNLGSFAVKLVTGIFVTVAQAMILFVLSIFFSIEKEQVINFISSLAGSRQNHMYIKMQKMYAKLGLRLKGQALVCLYVGFMILILYSLISWILGTPIPNTGTLAIIAGLTNLIPYLGPLVGMTIATFVTLVAGGRQAGLLALIIYIVVNQSENNILTPIIMNKTLGVSALLISICILLGGLVFGFIGVLLAVPIAVILTMAFDKK